MDARELARSARTTAAWTACEQAADYWFALAERVELEPEQPQRIRVALSPSSSRTVYPDTMPILGYFLSRRGRLVPGTGGVECVRRSGTAGRRAKAIHGSGHRVAAPGPITRLGPIGLALNRRRQFNEPELRRAEAACRPGFAAVFPSAPLADSAFLPFCFLISVSDILAFGDAVCLGPWSLRPWSTPCDSWRTRPCPCRRACRFLSCLRSRRSSSSIPMTASACRSRLIWRPRLCPYRPVSGLRSRRSCSSPPATATSACRRRSRPRCRSRPCPFGPASRFRSR